MGMSILYAIAITATQLFVIDGDTIVVGREHIRIANIDAPEIGHPHCDAELRLGHGNRRQGGDRERLKRKKPAPANRSGRHAMVTQA
jgi:endonuclease YncB( thermonuclease family)